MKRTTIKPSEIGKLTGGRKPPRSTSGKGPLEKTIVKNILKMLRENYPGRWYKTHGNRFSGSQTLDIVGAAYLEGEYPIYVEVEVKRRGEEPTDSQADIIENCTAVGAITGVARSKQDMADILAAHSIYPNTVLAREINGD